MIVYRVKRFVAIFSVLGIWFLLSPYLFSVGAQAQQICPPGFENLCKLDIKNDPNFFGKIIQILIVIAIVFSVVFLIYGGIRWIMSGGDKAKIEQAKSTIIAAIIGLIISILAYFIVTSVVYMLAGNIDLKTLKIPRLID